MSNDAARLVSYFKRNTGVIRMQTQGLSQAETLLIAPQHANCMNWVLGHIAQYRSRCLQWFGQPTVMTQAEMDRYARESEPITPDNALPLEQLLTAIATSYERMRDALKAEPALLAKPFEDGSLSDRMELLLWHETYHTGQLELFRTLTGRAEKLI